MKSTSSVTFAIMAGGRGERLWPLVRHATPKVCLSPDGKGSLLLNTIDRLRPVWPGAEWLIITTHEQARAVRAIVPAALRRSIIVEPQIKNTAACIALAAVIVAQQDPHRVVVAVPADHWIGNLQAFQRAVRAAIRAAADHHTLVTIGVRPTHPHPGLGYLCAGALLGGAHGARVFRLARFIEKPSCAAASSLLKRPRTYWNSGMFVATADAFLERITEWLPEHTRHLLPLAHGSPRTFPQRARKAYQALPAISFDHGVMERLRNSLVIEGRFSWADLGSWDAWARLGRHAARTLSVDSENVSVVGHDGHLVATIGVRNLMGVHTPTATLICRSDKTQAVRDIVKRLQTNRTLARYC